MVAPDVFTAMSDRGYVHLAFSSADVDAVAAELVSRGVELGISRQPTLMRQVLGCCLFAITMAILLRLLPPLSAYKNKMKNQDYVHHSIVRSAAKTHIGKIIMKKHFYGSTG